MRITSSLLVIITLVLNSCGIKSEPIAYGSDICHFCSMTIIDKQHGSEWVTDKGKVYKFDSVECLMNNHTQIDRASIALYRCNHYNDPGVLINAEKAIFLISEGIPSPMGAYLTAFDSRASAMKAHAEHGGKIYSWTELLKYWENTYVYDE
ncbi:MAG: nitrous oxide reductase accessory protein NosL [Flavobacteriaceae bacterium]